jgi:hypothetical protein
MLQPLCDVSFPVPVRWCWYVSNYFVLHHEGSLPDQQLISRSDPISLTTCMRLEGKGVALLLKLAIHLSYHSYGCDKTPPSFVHGYKFKRKFAAERGGRGKPQRYSARDKNPVPPYTPFLPSPSFLLPFLIMWRNSGAETLFTDCNVFRNYSANSWHSLTFFSTSSCSHFGA